jgi:DNA polymerase-3 subunit chi
VTTADGVSEVFFYHLQRQPLLTVLPVLLEKTIERGWHAVVQTTSAEHMAALDDHLWTHAEDGFLPHATDAEAELSAEPIVITTGTANPKAAQVSFLVEGADLPQDAGAYERIVLLFDGNDPDALAKARLQWKAIKGLGIAATYWQQNEAGRWEKKA